MTISDNIRSLRLKKRLSQEKLGELLNVSGQAVSKWEQGITSPDISLLPALAECFGVTIDSLFQGTDARRYPGYGNEQNELLALYMDENGTDEDFRRASDVLGEVILKGMATTEDYVSYGLLHQTRSRRDAEIALHYYHRAIEEGNGNRDLNWMLAHQQITNMLEQLGRIGDAVAEHRSWRDAEPDCAWARVSYAYALLRAGSLEEAYAEITEALNLAPDDGNVQTMAGDLCAQTGRYDEAVWHWDRAFECEPSSISCLFSKAEMFASIGQADKAIAQFEGILVWLKEHGFNMELEGAHPRRRIKELEAAFSIKENRHTCLY